MQKPPPQVHISQTITRAVPKPVGASSPNQVKKPDQATHFNQWSTDKNDLKGAAPLAYDAEENKATNKYKYTGPLSKFSEHVNTKCSIVSIFNRKSLKEFVLLRTCHVIAFMNLNSVTEFSIPLMSNLDMENISL